ncbi:hypothetical protein LINPERPRIM_LOCUS25305 [Linum perenne]
MGGNGQSSMLARSASKKAYSSKNASSTKSSLPSHGRTFFSNTYNRFGNRNADVEVQTPSKRRFTYEEKGKGKMQLKDKQSFKNIPRQNRGLIIREPIDNPRTVDNQMDPGGGDKSWSLKNINSSRINKLPFQGSTLKKESEAQAKSLPLQLRGPPSPPMNVDKEVVADINKALSDVVDTNKAARYMKEVRRFPKALCPQVPLSELEKAACEFETRKMMLFGQGCKGTGLNPISITDGSPGPSDLMSSARAHKVVWEIEKDDLGDAFIDFENNADAALDDAEAELEGEEGDVNLNDFNDEKDGLIDSVEGCFQYNYSNVDIEEMGSESETPTDQKMDWKALVKMVKDMIKWLMVQITLKF